MTSDAPPVVRLRPPARGWALPARPPEEWVAQGWSVLLTLLLGAAAVLPLTAVLRADQRTTTTVLLALLAGVVAAAAATLAYALLVQGTVSEDRRLTGLALGPLLLHPVVLALALSRSGADPPRAVLLLHGLLPLLVLAAPLARRLPLPLLPLPALALLLPGVLVVRALPPGAVTLLSAVAAVLTLLALLGWRRTTPAATPWTWVQLALALSAAALVGGALGARGSLALLLGALPLVVPAAGLGVRSALGYGRQARRWRALEQEVRDSRIPTALLPGRSVTPEDDEGLPEPREVQQALDTGAVLIALQPVLRLADSIVVGQEALARFGGRVPTDRWFRAASRCGLGTALELLCLERALALLPDLPASQFLAVNVSPAALADPRTLAALERAELSRVVVEVTEHEAVADYPGVRATLDRLRAGGARVAVDDTGAGYASLRHVLLLQPEVVKLDTALVRDLGADPRKRALVVALTSFAQEAGSTVLGEGIETPEQLEELTGIGVDLGQGWHLGVPVLPGEEPRTR